MDNIATKIKYKEIIMSNENRMNYGLIFLVAIIAAVLGSLVTYKTVCANKAAFAVVDLQRVVLSSKEIAALSNNRQQQLQELRKMADDANEKINAEKKEDAKKELSQKYLAEINAKKEAFDKTHASGLQAAEQNLNNIINDVAKSKGMTVVLTKSSVVNGGKDITDAVVELVK